MGSADVAVVEGDVLDGFVLEVGLVEAACWALYGVNWGFLAAPGR